MFGYTGSTNSTVADFNASTGSEGLGIGKLNVGLSNPSLDGVNLTKISSRRHIGISGNGITVDFLGNLYSNPLSSGAYEHSPE